MIKNRTAQLIYQTVYCTLGFVGMIASLGIFDNINMIRESADKLVDDAEKQSWNICAFCGKPAEATTNGWITRVCMNCVKDRKLSINGE